MDLVKAALFGIIQGVTEFLPISSTGHLILAGYVCNWPDDIAKIFFVFIQIGSMLAIILEYRKTIFQVARGVLSNNQSEGRLFYLLLVALLPTIFIGMLCEKHIKIYFYAPIPVANFLIIGGMIILWIESRNQKTLQSDVIQTREFGCIRSLKDVSFLVAFTIGLIQSFALIPGISRSAATIIAGLLLGLDRKLAVEFSFFLAIPILAGVAFLEFIKLDRFFFDQIGLLKLLIGCLVTFFTSLISIRMLLKYMAEHNFKLFAWYRIILGLLVLFVIAVV